MLVKLDTALLVDDGIIEALTMAAFEDEEKSRVALGINRIEWSTLGASFQDNWRSRTRAMLSILVKIISKE